MDFRKDAFGNVLAASGAAANDNAYRFSTKCADQETGLSYYGYRYYSATMGRWVNRDPAGEDVGGMNLFAFVLNDAVDVLDVQGLSPKSIGEVIQALREAAESNGVTVERLMRWGHDLIIDTPIFLAIGNAAHDAVNEKYAQTHPRQRVFYDQTINTIVKSYGKGDVAGVSGWLRPDIVHREQEDLYEVKSIRSESVGRRAVKDYLRVLREADVCTIKPGKERSGTSGTAIWPSGLRIEWHLAEPGLILYEVTDLPNPVPVPLPQRQRGTQPGPVPPPIIFFGELAAAAAIIL